ncbi:MAG: carbohydrate binding family 9 domain-containing protein [Candidatus Aminicenantes bacterium]|nr:carbohydrate binding family 9 domain-containing protein [Candidatus Aminicenantes bacterium]MDH5384642.1 carbohydrate binding family 9 domain-containing protein [Candidatus Aminicenantes bacterium]MDH5744534.1 carbohydrate binding family 9 domain-containing protein [Candidatus Aminicenantes bacterium]
MLKKIKRAKSILLFISIFLVGLFAFAEEKLEPLIPHKTDTPPVIDGILDDPVWQKSPYETGFKTYHPDYGKEMKEKTIVYYAYDRENIYFAFRCFDSEPDKIKASMTSRDNIRSDDWICINLDPFNDQQFLHVFYCNPLGIQGDSTYEGGNEDFSVDIVWYSAGQIDEEGYAIELKIPFKSLRFSHKNPVEMGIIFERWISRRSESGTYPPLDPKQGPNFLTQTRPLIFHDVKHYTLFEVLPGVTYSHRSEQEEGKLASKGGVGDLSLTSKYGITSHLIFDGTYNPDFSQVEADAGQVDFNLRYALFFEEKRSFFLEGLEKFNFGGFHEGDPLQEVVHTRTIVDPLMGFKLNGRIGDKNTVAAIYAMDELPEEQPENYAHFGIFRYKRALANDSFIGGFYTGRERESGYNRVLGLDGQWRLNKSSLFGYHGLLSSTRLDEESTRTDGHALGLHYLYTTRDWVVMLGLQDISEDFQTETGYITRTGITRFRSGIMHMFYPQSGIIKRIDPIVHSTQIRDRFSNLYETDNSFDLRFLLLRNSTIVFGYRYSTEVWLDESFNTSRGRFLASSQITKQFFFDLRYYYGKKIRYVVDPYQGSGSDAQALLRFLPSEKLHLELSLIYSDFYRDSDSEKEYDYTIFRNKTTFQVNKYLFFRAIVEYNSFRNRLMTDFLASFTYIPGTVIHIGYGSLYEKIRWEEGDYRPADNFLETRRGFFFKASYLWRL